MCAKNFTVLWHRHQKRSFFMMDSFSVPDNLTNCQRLVCQQCPNAFVISSELIQLTGSWEAAGILHYLMTQAATQKMPYAAFPVAPSVWENARLSEKVIRQRLQALQIKGFIHQTFKKTRDNNLVSAAPHRHFSVQWVAIENALGELEGQS
jgi:hypothetical protein